jgi:hypothetical protein
MDQQPILLLRVLETNRTRPIIHNRPPPIPHPRPAAAFRVPMSATHCASTPPPTFLWISPSLKPPKPSAAASVVPQVVIDPSRDSTEYNSAHRGPALEYSQGQGRL